ncbi:hypothetical protein JOC85_001098 [Bacillus mesophilus]|uniref:Uncharacterized protein n=1 Tax=Bacillus mesophilus TaxID=1808955 RepID=A0A6M0Q480_9BACI|nr:hypothetical protein [Bacillus mesophilus]MBM7660331.1 hypothetical protein [Bacillus mesophilus]NEY71042.1 hypothetical protein [Bacillus mesophilus]
MQIPYSEVQHYHKFQDTAWEILQSLRQLIGPGTFFVSHMDKEHFSIVKSLIDSDIILTEGSRLPLEEAY